MSDHSIRVWDGFVRLFHWLLVLVIGAAWWTAEQGGDWMDWHKRCGYALLGLVVFRVLWGFAGTAYARFRHFLYSPQRTLAYTLALLKGREPVYLSHNPLGGWAVVVLLLWCAAQAGTGLFANDDIMTEGPLVHLVGYDLSLDITRVHKLLFDGLLILAGLHIAAVAYHQRLRKEPLVQAMITGRKPAHDVVDQVSGMNRAAGATGVWLRGVILAAVAAASVWGLISL
ncbi:cytochrome b/b6 domain-containing protein [Thalassolituus sp. LLYu03]|uniref:cytochrome b/b6 domain-containing protein n=1 Tax=Thalassolituus sp. LLYu03 TaxID=3421656 RepID=UPI003D2A4D00